MIASFLIPAMVAVQAAPATGPCAGDPSCRQASAEQLFAAADELAGKGEVAEAEALLTALTQDPNPEYRAEARFRLAVLREALGDRPGAIASLRALLHEKPNAARARLELGRLLAAEGQTGEAARELQKAQAAGLPADVARTAGRFSNLLSATRRRGASIELTAGPDSNVNRATGSAFVDTVIAPFELDADARRQSGFGTSAGMQGYSRDAIGGLTLLTRGGVRGDLFAGKSRFNDIQFYAGSGPEFKVGSGRVRPAVTVERRWFGGDRYSRGFGTALSWIMQPTARSQLELDASVVRQAIEDNDVLDGSRYAASATWDQVVGPDTQARFNLRGAVLEAKAKPESLRQAGIEAILAHDLGFANLFGNAGMTKTRGRAPLALFGKTRDDERLDLGGGLVARRNWSGFAPLLRVTYTRSWSNIELYDYSRARLDIGVTREF
jgi:hypothetical protein